MRNGSVKDWGIGKWPKQKANCSHHFISGKIRSRWGDAIGVSRSSSFNPVFPVLAWCSGNNLLGSSISKVNLPSHSDAFFYLDFGPYHPEALSMHLFIYPLNPSSRKQRLPFSFLFFPLHGPQSTGVSPGRQWVLNIYFWVSKSVNDSLSQNIQQDSQVYYNFHCFDSDCPFPVTMTGKGGFLWPSEEPGSDCNLILDQVLWLHHFEKKATCTIHLSN